MGTAHPLKSFLDESHQSISDLARSARVSRPSLSRVLNGRRQRLDVESARRVHETVGGEVSLWDLLFWPDKEPSRSKSRRARRAINS